MGTTDDSGNDDERSRDALLGENAQLLSKVDSLSGEVDSLKHELQWFKQDVTDITW